jgi:hypothetical protein
MKTLQHPDPDHDVATQQVTKEAQWAQHARDLADTDYILRHYADKLGLVGCEEMYIDLSDGQLVNASLLDPAATVQL